MKTNPFVGRFYNAVVTAVKNDRVIFSITREIRTKEGLQTITDKAAYFVHGELINLHQAFYKGQEVSVRITKVCHPPQNSGWLSFVVRPEFLPVDIFLNDHPIGTVVTGIIAEINGSIMTVMLGDNVLALTKRSRNARTGNRVNCKIDKLKNDRLVIKVV